MIKLSTWELGWPSLVCHIVLELGAKGTSETVCTSGMGLDAELVELELNMGLELEEWTAESEVDSAEEDTNTEGSWSFKFGNE